MHDRDKHSCDCPARHPRRADSGPHIGCCKCIWCLLCEDWIKTSFWRKHQAMPDCKPIVPKEHSASDRVPEVISEDSLRDAAQELGLAEEEGYNATFRASCRECLSDIIDLLGGVPQGTKVRTAAWREVLAVLIDEREPDLKVAELLTLFPESERTSDLEAQLWVVVAHADDLVPKLSFS